MSTPNIKVGDVVIHKMTQENMIVLTVNVSHPNFIDRMVCCRYRLSDGRFAADNFLPSELIVYEENLVPSSIKSPLSAKDLRKKPGGDVPGKTNA